jgi:SAM-dependent methyltransferase
MNIKTHTAEQFDADAPGWTERMYARPEEDMRRRARLITGWGTPLKAGDSVLELGCGDGSLSCFLAKQGLRVTGLDISRGMIDEARRRAAREGVTVEFHVGDADAPEVGGTFDAAISFMGAFFMYVDDPRASLEKLSPRVRKKVILDWNHRSACTPVEAARMVADVGFNRVEWRPWFLPSGATSEAQRRLRCWLEERPLLGLMPLILRRWRYAIYIKGEKEGAPPDSHGQERARICGNSLPGTRAQRLLLEYGHLTRGKRRRI